MAVAAAWIPAMMRKPAAMLPAAASVWSAALPVLAERDVFSIASRKPWVVSSPFLHDFA